MTVQRIDTRFAELRRQGRAAFVPYVMAGDPHADVTLAILRGLPAAGADLIELGFPFSDPMAEGVPIQKAAQRALQSGMTLRRTLDLVRAFRTGAPFETTDLRAPQDDEGGGPNRRHGEERRASDASRTTQGDGATPVILMGYLNNVLTYGFTAFARDAADAGVDGLIVVDCPPEESAELADALDAEGVALIRLATPTSDDARLQVIAARTSGFVYYVSVAGVTGQKAADALAVAPAVARVRAASGLPVAVGFGIRTPASAAAVARVADAAVVGSALVDTLAAALDERRDPVAAVLTASAALADAVHAARDTAAA